MRLRIYWRYAVNRYSTPSGTNWYSVEERVSDTIVQTFEEADALRADAWRQVDTQAARDAGIVGLTWMLWED